MPQGYDDLPVFSPLFIYIIAYQPAKLLALCCFAEGAGLTCRPLDLPCAPEQAKSVSREMTATAPALELAPPQSVFAMLQDQKHVSRRQRLPREGGDRGAHIQVHTPGAGWEPGCKHRCAERAPHCQSRRSLRVPQQRQHKQETATQHQRAWRTWLGGKLRQMLCCC